MAHSKDAHGKKNGMAIFNQGHFEKKYEPVKCSDGRYADGEMSNPESLKRNADALSAYAKSHKAKH